MTPGALIFAGWPLLAVACGLLLGAVIAHGRGRDE